RYSGLPVGGVDRPEDGALAERLRGVDDSRGRAAARRTEEFRVDPEPAQAGGAERDLVRDQPAGELAEGRYLRVVVAVVADGHPRAQLPADDRRVELGEGADDEERRARVQAPQRSEDARRVPRRGAVVEGQRDRARRARTAARTERLRDEFA